VTVIRPALEVVRVFARRWLIVAVLTGAVAAALAPVPAVADAPPNIHRGLLVPVIPERGGAQVVDGMVEAGDHVGSRIIVGGTFTTIRLPDGSLVNQPNLAAFDANTGAFDAGFRPVVNGEVLAIERGETAGSLFIGGRFTSVNGVSRSRLAKLSAATGAPVGTWRSQATATVKTLDRFGNRLFVGGDFGQIGGVTRSRLAEVSAATGSVSAAFTIGVTGRRDAGTRSDGLVWNGGGAIVRSVRVNQTGTRLVVMHRGDQVGGQTRWGAAVIDISGAVPVVTAWRSRLWDQQQFRPLDFVGIVEGDLSPDGRMFVITNYVGNFPPLHDTVIAFPVDGADGVQPLWVTQMFDSTYSVAVSDAAAYVGGHSCWTESQQSVASPLYWPGRSGNEYSCTEISGSVFQPQTTFRYHLAALDLPTGRALDWDPRSNNSNNGVHFLRAIDRGLLVGHDGTRLHNVNVGRFGFFDFGPTFNAP
jgi:trimeric autotransporter adhesin